MLEDTNSPDGAHLIASEEGSWRTILMLLLFYLFFFFVVVVFFKLGINALKTLILCIWKCNSTF